MSWISSGKDPRDPGDEFLRIQAKPDLQSPVNRRRTESVHHRSISKVQTSKLPPTPTAYRGDASATAMASATPPMPLSPRTP